MNTSSTTRETEMSELLNVLMNRNGMTRDQAQQVVLAARDRVWDGESPEEVLEDEFGLEPDYFFDLFQDDF